MALPPKLKKKYSGRFDELIVEGENVVRDLRRNHHDVSHSLEWGTKCATLLMQVLPRQHPRRKELHQFGNKFGSAVNPPQQLAYLKAIRDDFVNDFFDDLGERVEAEIASDYMGQADGLLHEGQSGKFDHVPAAVLAGAVLERSLRGLCSRQVPAISTTKTDGKPLTLDPLIVALKKADVIKQTEAAQLSSWAHIRNKAAHGEFDQFTKDQVASMIVGVREFLARHA